MQLCLYGCKQHFNDNVWLIAMSNQREKQSQTKAKVIELSTTFLISFQTMWQTFFFSILHCTMESFAFEKLVAIYTTLHLSKQK